MPRLEESPYPLVFRVRSGSAKPPSGAGRVVYRVDLRSLEGMQKEALVSPLVASGAVWRLASDEGPYLNGTDLAPFPLGFFAAGLVGSFASELLQHARRARVAIDGLELTQETRYTMTGSALRGDMTGGALPVELAVSAASSAPASSVGDVVLLAARTCPGHAMLRDPLRNRFALCLNGRAVALSGLQPPDRGVEDDPSERFDAVAPVEAADLQTEIIKKIGSAERVVGVEGGVASSLQAEQKRTLHVQATARLCQDNLLDIDVRLFRPLGSTFRFLCDPAARPDGRTPSGLGFLAAGVAFCFMTQLGRYAHIIKQSYTSMRLVQQMAFRHDETGATATVAEPVETQVFLEGEVPPQAAIETVRMGEQTCFLHAAMRSMDAVRLRLDVNGRVALEGPVRA